MIRRCSCLCLIVFAVISVTNGYFEYDTDRKISVTVYYESKSNEAAKFVRQQLKPAVHLLQEYINLKLIPFGNAESVDYGMGGFYCPHGPTECLGNMMQDCALELMRLKKYADTHMVDYIACEMETFASTKNDGRCVATAGLDPYTVKKCIMGGSGTRLQLNSEYETGLVQPKYIPTVTINDVYNPKVQRNALRDLIGTICALLQTTQPCQNYYDPYNMLL